MSISIMMKIDCVSKTFCHSVCFYIQHFSITDTFLQSYMDTLIAQP